MSKDLSFVVQGPIIHQNNITNKTLESIRKYYPTSKIVLSTWEGEIITGLNCDKVLFNKDPGGKNSYYNDRPHLKNNNNRQIVSTLNGLKTLQTKYAVKTRTDSIFTNSALISLINNRLPIKGNLRLFRERIIAVSNLTINPRKTELMPFHPSDFFFAGLTEDLITYFDTPLMTDDEMLWNINKRVIHPYNVPELISKYANEQYMLIKLMQKKGVDFTFDHTSDGTNENLKLSDKIFGSQFELVSNRKLGVNNLKYPLSIFTKSLHIYTICEWKRLAYQNNKKKYFCFNLERAFYSIVEWIKIIIRSISKNIYLTLKKYNG